MNPVEILEGIQELLTNEPWNAALYHKVYEANNRILSTVRKQNMAYMKMLQALKATLLFFLQDEYYAKTKSIRAVVQEAINYPLQPARNIRQSRDKRTPNKKTLCPECSMKIVFHSMAFMTHLVRAHAIDKSEIKKLWRKAESTR